MALKGTSRQRVGARPTYNEEIPLVLTSIRNSSIIPGTGIGFCPIRCETMLACRVRMSSNGAVANDASRRDVDPAISGIYACRFASSSIFAVVEFPSAKFVA
eukprot:CAMPEP_0201907070 /NCGR_PEP_ID=MMETSP0902-20130614/57344_1 /ASSEMBLY_ACC=CAM_ASM_000551 /TAXON_ID=420261 /ORGANISM="Thalassiosira antarctica, Strain CCMP982" /LENGTH=101 /DNA_ID=CAMNT_0048441217 /DNA_START=891 /DNA_END=1196 /DNA_ORIENTATION=-